MTDLAELVDSDPGVAAAQILGAAPNAGWLDELIHKLSTGRPNNGLATVLETWHVSQAEFASLVGVSRQAVGKWLSALPPERAVMVADLSAATEVLVHYVRRDRIPAVVRRKASALGGLSLVDMIERGDTGAVLTAVRDMFDPAHATA
jgi:DNA-binding transcriptional regulator YdaS (Cro superfamily)